MKSNRVLKLAIACALVSASAATVAQNAPKPEEKTTEMEIIVVTGSYIKGTAEDAALPVDVLTSEEVAKQGAPTTVELIKSLPGVGAVFGDSNQFAAGTAGNQGQSNINFRGIGSQRALILFNGRRSVADANLLPMMAVGQIEVLKTGAAATYGSDAISGVVNFISRKNFDGVEVNGGYTIVPGSAENNYEGSVLYGYKGDNGSNILLGAAYQHRSELKSTARDWAIQPYTTNPTGWSGASNPGVYNFVDGTGATLSSVRDANCGAVGGYPGFANLAPRCFFYYVPFDNLVEEQNRFQVYGEANANLSDSVRLHIDAMYAKSELPDYRVSPGYNVSNGPTGPGTPYTIPFTNPGYAAFLAQTGAVVPAGAVSVQASVGSPWRPIAQGGNPTMGGTGGQKRNISYDSFRVSGGLSGDITETLHWDTAITYIGHNNQQNGPDLLIDRLQRALNGLGGANCVGTTPGANGCQYYNPFSNAYRNNPAIGVVNPGFVAANANDPALIQWMIDKQLNETVYSASILDAVVNGELPWSLPGGAIGWALGGQARQSQSHYQPGSAFQDQRVTPCPVFGSTTCSAKTGPYIFLGQSVPNYLSDHVYAAFGELSLPVLDSVNAQLSLRYEDYGGLTGSTTNPKLSVKWQIVDAVAVRGSIGTTFRGPTPGNRSLSGATGFTAIAQANNQSTAIDSFGNPNVGPETATTINIGTILTLGGFRASIDAWSIKLEDQITTAGTGPSIAAAVAPGGVVNCASPLAYLVTFTQPCVNGMAGTTINRIRIDTVNGAPLKVDGIDFAADYMFDNVLGGKLSTGVNGTYMHKYHQDAFISPTFGLVTAAYDGIGYLNFTRGIGPIARWRGNAFVEYNPGIHTFRLDANYISGVTDDRGPITVQTAALAAGACTVATARAGLAGCQLITFGNEVDDYLRFSLTYQVELPWDLTVTAAINNILDTDPPEVRMEYSYDPNTGVPEGRTYRVNFRKKF